MSNKPDATWDNDCYPGEGYLGIAHDFEKTKLRAADLERQLAEAKAEIESMRPVVEAAIAEKISWESIPPNGTITIEFFEFVAKTRDRVTEYESGK